MKIKHNISLKSLIISFILGFSITSIIGLNKHPIYPAIIIFICYLSLVELEKEKEPFSYSQKNYSYNSKGNKSIKNSYSILNNDPHEGELHSLNNKKNRTKNPLDGLSPKQLMSKLNYLYYATSHPFKPKSYIKYKLDEKNKNENDLKAPESLKHIQIAKYDYPSISQDQINFDDCMNHTSGHLLSCNQGDNIHASLLTNGISNKKNLSQVVREDFSPPEFINQTKNNIKSLFNTAPYDVKYNQPRNSSNDLCSNCSVTELENVNYLL